MKKRLLLIALVILLSTGTVVQTEMHAEAAATTVTAVTVAKAVLVLLAIAGVGIASGYAWENGEQIKEDAVATFTTWLQNHDPEYYTALMLAATNITAGRVINTYDALFFGKLKQYTREYFGTSTSTTTEIGTNTFNVNQIAIILNGSQYVTDQYGNKYYSNNVPYSVIPVLIKWDNLPYVFCLLPTNFSDFANNENTRYFRTLGTKQSVRVNGVDAFVWYWQIYGELPYLFFDPDINISQYSQLATALETVATKYYSGDYANVTENVIAKPFVTSEGVAATAVQSTVVSSGQTITEDDEGEIVIDGDTTVNLSNVNIDEWLKSLSEGVTSYADAMEQIGLAAVNTQTMTLEQVQSIAQALNPAAAGTDSITGNYTVALSDLFPFCIPFDLYNIISCFKADPVAPSAEITIPVGYDGTTFTWETYTVSLSAFDAVAAVVRVLEYIGFVIGLMLITRKLIEG